MPFYYTPYILLPLLSAVINGSLACYAWKRRRIPEAQWLFLLLTALALWDLSYALNISALQLWQKNLFFKYGASFVLIVTYAFVPLTLLVTGYAKHCTRRTLVGLSLVPILSLLLTWTNDLHGLMRNNLHLVNYDGLLLFGYTNGVFFKRVHLPYVYIVMVSMTLLCLWGLFKKNQLKRGSLAAIICSSLIPNFVDMLDVSPIKELRFTTSTHWFCGICYFWAVFRGQMLNLVPLAKNALFDQMQEPVLVLNQEGHLAENNQAARDNLGIQDTAVGRSIHELFPAKHPLHDLNTSTQTVNYYDETNGRRWHVTQSPLLHKGTQIGKMLVLHDMTELHQAQNKLRINEERFRRLTDESADMVWQLDSALHFTYVNRVDQAMRGYTPEEVIGKSVFSFLNDEGIAVIRQSNTERFGQEQHGTRTEATRYEIQMLCKDGSYLWTEVHSNPLRNDDGEIIGYIGVTRDISKRKVDEQLMAETLLKEQEMRSEQDRFLDMISHEYRTPLAIIQSNISLMELKRCPHCNATTEPLIKMNRAVERLVDIFETFRRRKGIGQRTLIPEFERIETTKCFTEIFAAARDFWGDRFQVITEPTAGVFIKADLHLLRTAVLNLLDNAVKYSTAATAVTLNVQQHPQQLVLQIQNHSAEPLANNTDKLFQKFKRGGNSVGTSGTGMGLYLADEIIRDFGGALTLHVAGQYDVTVEMILPLEQ